MEKIREEYAKNRERGTKTEADMGNDDLRASELLKEFSMDSSTYSKLFALIY